MSLSLTPEQQATMKPEDQGFMMGNLAINDAIEKSQTIEDLQKNLTELRFTAIFILAQMAFNQGKVDGPTTFNMEVMEKFISQNEAIMRGTIANFNKQFESGALKVVKAGEKI